MLHRTHGIYMQLLAESGVLVYDQTAERTVGMIRLALLLSRVIFMKCLKV